MGSSWAADLGRDSRATVVRGRAGRRAASLFAATALAQTVVPNNWPLIPSGLSGGDQFRLMLVVEELKDATATSLGTYDSFVRGGRSAPTGIPRFAPIRAASRCWVPRVR